MKFIHKIVVIVFGVLGLCGNVPVQADATVSQIATGNGFVLFIKSDGSLWTAGYNLTGETGNPSTYLVPYPYSLSFPMELVSSNVTAASAGLDFSVFLKSDGSLWGMGSDAAGQLGMPQFFSGTNIPTKIFGSNVVAVNAGDAHTVFRAYTVTGPLGNQTITMLVEGMGNDQFGQLGNYSTKTSDYYASPVTIEFESTKFFPAIAPVCGGSYSSFYVKPDGTLWAMGNNEFGELGDGTTNIPPGVEQVAGVTNVTDVQLNGHCTIFLESDGSLWSMGFDLFGEGGGGPSHLDFYTTPQKIVGSNVVAISVGAAHTLFLKTDSTLWGMGVNDWGELGALPLVHSYPSPILLASNVVNFAAGSGTTYYTRTDGTTWASGEDTYGELADGFVNTSTTNAEQIFPYPPAVFTSEKFLNRTNLQITATCPVGGAYSLVSSTDLKAPLHTWPAIAGSLVTTRGPDNFVTTIVEDQNTGQRFFALVKTN